METGVPDWIFGTIISAGGGAGYWTAVGTWRWHWWFWFWWDVRRHQGGAGNTPSTSPSQEIMEEEGFAGGAYGGGGGGGASAVGTPRSTESFV